MSTGYCQEGIKAGMCDAALCAPCTWAPLQWLVSLKRRYNKCSTFTFTFIMLLIILLLKLLIECKCLTYDWWSMYQSVGLFYVRVIKWHILKVTIADMLFPQRAVCFVSTIVTHLCTIWAWQQFHWGNFFCVCIWLAPVTAYCFMWTAVFIVLMFATSVASCFLMFLCHVILFANYWCLKCAWMIEVW